MVSRGWGVGGDAAACVSYPDAGRTHDACACCAGVRRLNAEKNIGQARYAFNTLQQAMLPAEYRPPPGTGGGSHT